MIGLEKKRARISVGELAYVDEGDPESPPVVLLHGFPTSSHLWRHLAPLLSPWMRAIAPDLLGCGDSENREEADLRLPAQASYVRELLDGLGVTEFAVVGHGLGGGIVQLLALGGGVRTMVLIDAYAFDAWPSGSIEELQRREPADLGEPLIRALIALGFEYGMGHRERLADEDLEEYCRPYVGTGGPEAFFRLARALDGRGLAGLEAELVRLEVPTLILWGEEDAFVPVSAAERLAHLLPMSSLALLPGCGHFLTEDAPETVVPLVFEYLRSKYLGTPHGHTQAGPVTVELGLRPPSPP